MQRLSGLDAGFLHQESPTVHLPTLKNAVLDPATVPGGYSYDRFRGELAARLARDYADAPLTVICIAEGATRFVGDLLRLLAGRGVEAERLDVRAHRTEGTTLGPVQVEHFDPDGLDGIESVTYRLSPARGRRTVTTMATDAPYDLLSIGRWGIPLPLVAAGAFIGTNDLTQTTMGLSRDDAEEAFLGLYVERGLFARNPFESIDPHGVGRLIELAINEGRAANPELIVGVCGEHGADPESIVFFQGCGVDYVSCSPPRLPIARLAAAQAALLSRQG